MYHGKAIIVTSFVVLASACILAVDPSLEQSTNTEKIGFRTKAKRSAKRSLLRAYVYASKLSRGRDYGRSKVDCGKVASHTRKGLDCIFTPPFDRRQFDCVANVGVEVGVFQPGNSAVARMTADLEGCCGAITWPKKIAKKMASDFVSICASGKAPRDNEHSMVLESGSMAPSPSPSMDITEYEDLIKQYVDAEAIPTCEEVLALELDETFTVEQCELLNDAIEAYFASADLSSNSTVVDGASDGHIVTDA